jgi:hypothetical protein
MSPRRLQGDRRHVFDYDFFHVALPDHVSGVEDFYPYELFILSNIQRDVLVQANRPALMSAVNETYVQRVNFGIVAYLHVTALHLLKIIRIHRNDDNFIVFLDDNRANLFDCIMPVLPERIKAEIVSVHNTAFPFAGSKAPSDIDVSTSSGKLLFHGPVLRHGSSIEFFSSRRRLCMSTRPP